MVLYLRRHGSTRILRNEAGQTTDRYVYDACGNLLKKEGDTKNDFLYTGEQYNAETGLYYLRARYMDPSGYSALGLAVSMEAECSLRASQITHYSTILKIGMNILTTLRTIKMLAVIRSLVISSAVVVIFVVVIICILMEHTHALFRKNI